MTKRALPFAGLGREGWERLADASALLALALVVVVSGAAVYLYYGVDFRGYYAAARVVLAGGDPYDYDQVSQVLLDVTGRMGNNPYYYPPWFCLLVVPLALLPMDIARGVWIAASWGLLIGGLALSLDVLEWRVRGWRRWLLWLSAFYLFGWVCLKFEQLGILLFFCLAWALWAVKRGKNVQAGLAMALLLTKPNVTLLAWAYLAAALSKTHRKAVTWGLAWLGLLAGGGTLAFPGWLARLFQPDFGIGLSWLLEGPDRVLQQRRLCTLLHWLEAWGITGAMAWVLLGALAAAGLTLAWRSPWLRSDRVYGASLGIVLTLLLTPYALLYDYTPLIVGQLWVYRRLSGGVAGVRRWVTILILLFMFSVLLWAGPESDGYWLALGMWTLLLVLGTGPVEPRQMEGALAAFEEGRGLG